MNIKIKLFEKPKEKCFTNFNILNYFTDMQSING